MGLSFFCDICPLPSLLVSGTTSQINFLHWQWIPLYSSSLPPTYICSAQLVSVSPFEWNLEQVLWFICVWRRMSLSNNLKAFWLCIIIKTLHFSKWNLQTYLMVWMSLKSKAMPLWLLGSVVGWLLSLVLHLLVLSLLSKSSGLFRMGAEERRER